MFLPAPLTKLCDFGCTYIEIDVFQVFDRHAASMGIPNELVALRPGDHNGICQNLQDDPKSFRILCEKMVTSLSKSLLFLSRTVPDIDFPVSDPEHIECLLTLASMSRKTQISPSKIPAALAPRWILEDKNYLSFIKGSSNILRIVGQSGSGISVVSSIIPDFLRETFLAETEQKALPLSGQSAAEFSEDPIIITFSFDSRDHRTCCTAVLFASLTQQLLRFDPGCYRYIQHMYTQISTVGWDMESLWILFRSLILSPSLDSVYCIVDAIDKCDPHRNHFLDEFLQLAQSENATLKVIFTSDDLSKFKDCTSSIIDIDERQTKQVNLEDFLDHEIVQLEAERPAFKSYSISLRERILAMEPSLLLVSLIFKWLHGVEARSTESEMQSVMNAMPQSLPALYQEVYISPSSSFTWKWRALSWITHAFRPLKIGELATAIAVETQGGFQVNESNRPKYLSEDLKRTFGAFLSFHDEEVSLAHGSVKEFLLEWQESEENKTKLEERRLLGHGEISSICLDYLLNVEWDEFAVEDSNEKIEGTSSLFSYAATYWHLHYRLSNKPLDLVAKVNEFLENEERTTLWARVKKLEGSALTPIRDTSRSIFITADLGLNDILLSMIDEGSGTTEERSHVLAIAADRGDMELIIELEKRNLVPTKPRPLLLAAQSGYLVLVKHLLEIYSRGDQDLFKEALSGALHGASQNGYIEVVNELLKDRPSVDMAMPGVPRKTPLHRAAEYGHAEVCQRLHQEHVDVDASDENGCTALHLATLSGQLLVMETLLENEAKVSLKDNSSLCPLHHAGASGFDNAVTFLIGQNGDPNSMDELDQTPLHLAVEEGHLESVQRLLDAGADVNIVARLVGTPSHIVARTGNLEMAKLLASKAELVLPDNEEKTAIQIAASYGHTGIIDLFLDKINADDDDEVSHIWEEELPKSLQSASANGSLGAVKLLLEKSPFSLDDVFPESLLAAATRGNLGIVEALVKAGAEPLSLPESFPALHEAARLGDVEVINALLFAGLSLSDDPSDESTPLHLAVQSGSADAVDMLLRANADVDTQDTTGLTALLHAAALGHLDIVKLLLAAGAESAIEDDSASSFLYHAVKGGNLDIVNLALSDESLALKANNDNLIPLHVAAEEGQAEVVERLLKLSTKEQQVSAKTEKQRTALHLAAKNGNLDIVKHLVAAKSGIDDVDAKGLSALYLATKKRHHEVVKHLIDEKADPHQLDSQGRNSFFLAFQNGDLETLKVLEPGETQNLEIKDTSSNTLLHVAAQNNMTEYIAKFIALKFDVEARNNDARTPLLIAAGNGYIDSVKVLLEANASLDAVDEEGNSVLSKAVWSGNKDLVILLVDAGANKEEEGVKWPAVCTAAYRGDLQILQYLISQNWDYARRGPWGWTPLHAAYDSIPATTALLDAGAKPDEVCDAKETPLELAISRGYADTAEEYLKRGHDPLRSFTASGQTYLHLALPYLDQESFDVILKYTNADDFDIKDNEGITPLQQAVKDERLPATKLLLSSSKCKLEQKDPAGNGLLALAAETNNWKMIEHLLETGAELDPALGEKLLEKSAEGDEVDMMELLIRKGCIVNQTIGESMLRKAAKEGSLALVKSLLERDAKSFNPNATDEHGWTPDMFAQASQHFEIAELLKEARKESKFTVEVQRPSGMRQTEQRPRGKRVGLIAVEEDPLLLECFLEEECELMIFINQSWN